MKVSLNWIKDYVKLPDDMDLKKLAYDLTMSTVEVEGVKELARQFDGIVVGKICEVLPHPNADKLRICKTDIGDGEIKDITVSDLIKKAELNRSTFYANYTDIFDLADKVRAELERDFGNLFADYDFPNAKQKEYRFILCCHRFCAQSFHPSALHDACT